MSAPQSVINFTKALHHAAACKFFIEAAMVECPPVGAGKALCKDLANRADKIVTMLLDRISPEARAIIKHELRDPLAMSTIIDLWASLGDDNREKLEAYADKLYQTELS